MIFSFGKHKEGHTAPVYLHNTLTNKKELFEPPGMHPVKMYNCGPTVYDRQHIGNLSSFVFADTLRRMFEYNGLKVEQVINITDVGHLTSDADEGEDKMRKGLKTAGLALTLENMRELGEQFTKIFLEDLVKLNVETTDVDFPRASDYIDAQIAMIQTLEEKGYTYTLKDGVYFDTSLFPNYGALGNIDVEKLKEGARVAIKVEKKNPADFALWKFNSRLGWKSPWGRGFPGWHIECSAMVRSTLGEQIDIHTGGIEHIAIHHNNEIAQSESATGKKPFSRFWLHRAHIQMDSQKMAKSEGRVVYLSDISEKGMHPLAFRYWLLGGHYKTPMNFTWEALENANRAFLRLHRMCINRRGEESGDIEPIWQKRFHARINDDLDIPGALAVLWEMTKDESISNEVFVATVLDFDRVLGLTLGNPDAELEKKLLKEFGSEVTLDELPDEVKILMKERESARKNQDWENADELRKKIEKAGYSIKDTSEGPSIIKK